jgi:nucleoside-diphosphate-sugar epimerase
VHSSLDQHGFVLTLIASARAAGRSGYAGDGANRWPAGHTLDAGRLYRLALEKAPEGSRLHAVGDAGIPVRQIAETIGRRLGVPAASILTELARPIHHGRQPDLQRPHPATPGLEANPPRPHRRP